MKSIITVTAALTMCGIAYADPPPPPPFQESPGFWQHVEDDAALRQPCPVGFKRINEHGSPYSIPPDRYGYMCVMEVQCPAPPKGGRIVGGVAAKGATDSAKGGVQLLFGCEYRAAD